MKSVILGLIVLSLYGYGSDSDLQRCINKASSDVELRECLSTEYEYQDFLLNKYYKELQKQQSSAEDKKVLRDAQRAWIKYRDANCEFEALPMKNGSGWTTLHLECILTMTKQRAKELKDSVTTVYRD